MGDIIVSQQGNKRIMRFASDQGANLEQTSVLIDRPWKLQHEYTQIMLLGLLFVEARHITLLGLGGGGLLHCIRHFFPRLLVQVVEQRQRVIDTAYQWFNLPKHENIQIQCAEAADFLHRSGDFKTDLIFSDLYEAEGMSGSQAQLAFIQAAYGVLNEHGWLLINFHQLPAADSELMRRLRALFAEIYICDIFSGNRVLFCGRSPLLSGLSELSPYARRLAKTLDMPLFYYFNQLKKL